jgi:predicted NAD-dependent protein-ADP-ribosyltransferase YbiA (DUF1768 family)
MGGPAICDGETLHCVDNFLECGFVIESVSFGSVEQFFQWRKCTTDVERDRMLEAGTGADVWGASRHIVTDLRSDWEEIKVDSMLQGIRAKFTQNDDLRAQIVKTTGEIDFGNVAGSFWDFWNQRLCELVRAEMRQGTADAREGDADVIAEVEKLLEQYRSDEQREVGAGTARFMES